MDPESLVGAQIDRYLVQEYIKSGGMADVYLAYESDLDRRVALKVMKPSFAYQEEFMARFSREGQSSAHLIHPNIIRVYATGITSTNQPYLAMEYCERGALSSWLDRLAVEQRLLPTSVALDLLRQIADALNVAHSAGIVHRDLKPSNILLRKDGTPVLTDLGIAAVRAGARLTETGALLGTPQYMSPEQATGKSVDGRSDIYSLGIILYELLAGSPPFDAHSPWGIVHQHLNEPPPNLEKSRPDVSNVTTSVVSTCLQKLPERRYQTAGELSSALKAAIAAEGTDRGSTLPVSPGTRDRRLSLPRLAIFLALGVCALLLAIILLRERPGSESELTKLPAEVSIVAVDVTPATEIPVPAESLAVHTTTATRPADNRVASPTIQVKQDRTATIATASTTAEQITETRPSTIATPTPEPVVAFQTAPLDAYANDTVDDSGFPPTGAHELGGVPFYLSNRAFKSQASSAPHNQYPAALLLPMAIPRASRVHLLLNTGNGYTHFYGRVVGEVLAYCDGASTVIADLELGKNIREWHIAENVVSSAPEVRQVWSGSIGHIDLLSIDLPRECLVGSLTGLEILDLSSSYGNSLDPALNLLGVTVEYFE